MVMMVEITPTIAKAVISKPFIVVIYFGNKPVGSSYVLLHRSGGMKLSSSSSHVKRPFLPLLFLSLVLL
jgi:hypothetical protein